MNEHQHMRKLLAIYDDLSLEEQRQVAAHLRTCAACAARLELYQAMDRQLADLTDVQPEARLRSTFYEQLEIAGKRRWSFGLRQVPGLIVQAAALALIAILFISLWLAIREQGAQPVAVPEMAVPTTTATPSIQPPTLTPLPTATLLPTATPLPVWEIQRVQQLPSGLERVSQVALAVDGSMLVAAGNEQMQLWQVDDWQLAGSWPMPSLPGYIRTINSLALSADGSLLAAGSLDYNGYVVVWRPPERDYANFWGDQGDAITSLAFSQDGRFLASGTSSNDRMVYLWQTADGTRQQQLITDGIVNDLAFAANNETLVAGTSAGTVWLWHIDEGQVVENWMTEGAWVTAVAVHERAIGAGFLDGRVRLWQVGEMSVWQELDIATTAIRTLTFSADGSLLAVAAADGTVSLWQVRTTSLQELLVAETADAKSQVIELTFTPEGLLVATGLSDGTIEIWQASLNN